MIRFLHIRTLGLGLALAVLGALPPAAHAVSEEASSRIRNIEGHREVRLRTENQRPVLDTLAARGLQRGYQVVSVDAEDGRLVLEKPAALGDVSLLKLDYAGTERLRLRFEIYRPEEKRGVRVVGALVLVTDPGTAAEKLLDLGKRQPYRNELKALVDGLKRDFGAGR